MKLEYIVFALVVVMAAIVGCTGCQTVGSTIDTGSVIETQTNVVAGGQSAEEQSHDLVEQIVTINDPVLISKAKTLDATVTKLNADIKKANASIVDYIKASENTSKAMFKLAIENEKLKAELAKVIGILVLLALVIAGYVFAKIKKLSPF